MDNAGNLADLYVEWLRSKISLKEIGDWMEVTFPYLDRHNDYLQIYVRKYDSYYRLMDDGYVINDLLQSGCRLDTPKRKNLMDLILNGFGVSLVDNTLEVKATEHNLACCMHSLIQAMLALNDLFYLASPVISHIFYEDVIAWLKANDIIYVENPILTGKSGFKHHFDLLISRSEIYPDRYIQIVDRPTRDEVVKIAFSWYDTRDARDRDSKAYALLDDSEREIPPNVTDALQNYEVKPVLWSNRNTVVEELAA
ncbi:MAG: DUF1829 domain-containing protein [Methanothrix sp.]|jgi:hypothetical protein|nr:DUF1829 domain-containing protein [Methanothrix sp.]